MVQLPKKLGGYGLGPRTFSLGNDSSAGDDHAKREWTETPFEREKRLAVCFRKNLHFFIKLYLLIDSFLCDLETITTSFFFGSYKEGD